MSRMTEVSLKALGRPLRWWYPVCLPFVFWSGQCEFFGLFFCIIMRRTVKKRKDVPSFFFPRKRARGVFFSENVSREEKKVSALIKKILQRLSFAGPLHSGSTHSKKKAEEKDKKKETNSNPCPCCYSCSLLTRCMQWIATKMIE